MRKSLRVHNLDMNQSSCLTNLAVYIFQDLKKEKEDAAAALKLQEQKAEERLQYQLKQQVYEKNRCQMCFGIIEDMQYNAAWFYQRYQLDASGGYCLATVLIHSRVNMFIVRNYFWVAYSMAWESIAKLSQRYIVMVFLRNMTETGQSP